MQLILLKDNANRAENEINIFIIWSDVNRRLFETIATISRVQLFLSQ